MPLTADAIAEWTDEIADLNKKARTHASSSNLNAFYGSSSIRLWEEMAADLSPHSVINLGFGGSTYGWCNHFFEDVFSPITPSKIFLYAGDNDLGTGESETDILANLRALLEKIHRAYGGIPIVLMSVKPSPHRLSLRSNIENLNAQLLSLSEELAQGSFIDIYTKMLKPNGDFREELFTEDMLHMNEKGYEIWKEAIYPHLV